ncbi:MAG: UDP-N-acetylmuramate dehydrogenase [Candidatus Babeliales bacterium]
METSVVKSFHKNYPRVLIQENVPLANKNWFRTGGSARFFCEPTTDLAFQDAVKCATDNSLPLFLLGTGANILVSDSGFNGLVIRPQLKDISIDNQDNTYARVTAGAGVLLDDFIEFCLEHNLSGLEEFSGIPGTIGGAVFINLHYFQYLFDQFLVQAQVIEKNTGIMHTVDNNWFNFGYNQSTLNQGNHFLLNATFKVKKISTIEVAFAKGRKQEIIRHRTARYPSKNTCGSFFRNFKSEEVEDQKDKIIHVAYYLDKIGAKRSLFHGGAQVSPQHANMIINTENASSNDIIQVARTMQQQVKNIFNILPQPECRLIGFDKYPLIT